MYGVMANLYTTPLFYITVIVWTWAGLCPDMVVVYIRRTFFPKGSNILQALTSHSPSFSFFSISLFLSLPNICLTFFSGNGKLSRLEA